MSPSHSMALYEDQDSHYQNDVNLIKPETTKNIKKKHGITIEFGGQKINYNFYSALDLHCERP